MNVWSLVVILRICVCEYSRVCTRVMAQCAEFQKRALTKRENMIPALPSSVQSIVREYMEKKNLQNKDAT